MKKQTALKTLALTALVAGALSTSAFASTTTSASVVLNATITNQCTISANQTTIPALGITPESDLTSFLQISAICNPGTQESIAIDQGQNYNKSTEYPSTNTMVDTAGDALSYTLYQDSAMTTPWGSGTQAFATTATNSTGAGDLYQVAAKILGADRLPQGAYTDTVTVSDTFQ